MLDLFKLPEPQILLFAMILLRIIAFIFSSAVLGSASVSVQVKIMLAMVLSFLLLPTVKIANAHELVISDDIVFMAMRELLIGLTLGFLTRIYFFAVTMTGDLVSISMGLNASQMFNPLLGQNGNTIDQFYSTLATLIFFGLNGHHILISAIAQSFEYIPVNHSMLNWGVYGELATMGQKVLLLSIKMAAPIIVTILMTNLAMGIIGRSIPQINVLVTSMPVTISIGMAVVFICLPLLALEMNGVLDITTESLFSVMKHL